MIKVLYHGTCPDGFTAAWVARKKLGDNAEYIPCFYGQEPPDVEGHSVYIVDFSFPRPVLERIAIDVKDFDLLVLDHHKTAKVDLDGLSYCRFDMNRSGAGMTWDHFFPATARPLFVNYIEDHDLWRFKLPNSELARTYRECFAMTWENWDALERNFQDTQIWMSVAKGADLFKQQMIEEMASHAVLKDVGGIKMPVVNCAALFSEVADLLAQKAEVKCAAYYFDREDGKRQWGLRSCGGPDVSEIAKKYGGGGHRNSAGFIT